MVCSLAEGVSPVLSLGEFDHGSAPVYANGVEVGRISMFADDRFMFSGSSLFPFSFSSLGDSWLEAVASWFVKASVICWLK